MRRLTPNAVRGFTLPEIIVAMVMFGVVSTVLMNVMNTTQKVTTAEQVRAAMQSNLRVASLVVPNELRMLNQSDTTDIQSVTDNSIIYRAMRGYYSVCAFTSLNSIKVMRVDGSGFSFDYRSPIATDSIFVFRERDTTKISDDRWVRSEISAVATTTCNFGSPVVSRAALTLTLGGTGLQGNASVLADYMLGAPVRTFELTRLEEYTDANGDKWLGMCTGSATCTLQPVVGPLANTNGFLLTRYNDAGNVVTGNSDADRNSLRSLRIRFIGKSENQITRGTAGNTRFTLNDTLSTLVTLRNVKQN